MFEPTRAPREGTSAGEWVCATVDSVSEAGVFLNLGGGVVTQKPSPRLAAAANLAQGDSVLCARVSGVLVVLDKIVY